MSPLPLRWVLEPRRPAPARSLTTTPLPLHLLPSHWFKHLLIGQELILISRPSHWPQTAASLAGADGLQTGDQVEWPLIG